MSPPIKRKLCEIYKPKGDNDYPRWLLKVRPIIGHTAHFHIRLKCPTDAKHCDPQEPVVVNADDSTGVECSGPRFNYWFETDSTKDGWLRDSIPAKTPPPKPTPTPPGPTPTPKPEEPRWKKVLKTLPKECHQLLHEAGVSEPN